MSGRKGTYYEIEQLEKRVEKLEEMLAEFMERWGPDTQRKRDERDAKWDEMIRVLTVQERKKAKKERNRGVHLSILHTHILYIQKVLRT